MKNLLEDEIMRMRCGLSALRTQTMLEFALSQAKEPVDERRLVSLERRVAELEQGQQQQGPDQ